MTVPKIQALSELLVLEMLRDGPVLPRKLSEKGLMELDSAMNRLLLSGEIETVSNGGDPKLRKSESP